MGWLLVLALLLTGRFATLPWKLSTYAQATSSARASTKTAGNSTLDELDLLDQLLKSYDRRALPGAHLGKPTVVHCEIYIRSFGSINPATMDYAVDLYLRQRWADERLMRSSATRPLDLNDPKLVQRIWKPEVFFPNAKDADFQYVTVPNVLVRINPEGIILYMLRLKLRFSCMMDLYRYPMDCQVCTIELASFSKTIKELQLQWSVDNPVILYDNLKLPQFEIENVSTTDLCKEKFHIGEYSCLKAEFYLRRSLGFHLVQTYLPTILIVVISWVSFWLDVESIPARITLGVTTLLTISSKGSGVQSNLPPVSYVKAVDVWMGACTTFVFMALLEFTLVNYLWRKRPQAQIFACPPGGTVEILDSKDPAATGLVKGPGGKKQWQKAKRIDQLSRVTFPVLFLVFNVIYWPYYMI